MKNKLARLLRHGVMQVALQLWQRDRANLDKFSINVQRYPQNIKIVFLGHPMGHQGQCKRFIWKF